MSATAGTLAIEDGIGRAEIAPGAGGAVAAFAWRGRDVLRRATAEAVAAGDPLGMASFPLVPFAGRIAGGRFAFGDRTVTLSANLAGEPSAIHGQGWQAPWRVAGAGGATARLTLDHAPGEWPWAWRAEQNFSLSGGVLSHTLSVTNLSDEPMPSGLGLHPYFPRDPDMMLEAEVSGVFLDPAQPPAAIPAAWDWRGGRTITRFVDHQFSGWSGAARIAWPSRGLAVRMTTQPALRFLVVFAPDGGDFVCVEPVSHQLDAVNRSDGGAGHHMAILAPGARLSLTLRLEPETVSGA
jgi:aldose 1-epimerase